MRGSFRGITSLLGTHYFRWWMTCSHARTWHYKKRPGFVQIFSRSLVYAAVYTYFYLNYRAFSVCRIRSEARGLHDSSGVSRRSVEYELTRNSLSFHSLHFTLNPFILFMHRSPSWRSIITPSRKDFGIPARGSARKSEYRFQNCSSSKHKNFNSFLKIKK